MKAIINYLKKCPVLSDLKVREDYLGPESGSVAIAPDGGEQTVKVYASGDMLGQISFKILVRENFIGSASELLLKIADWISCSPELPDMIGNKTSQYVEVTEGPILVKTDVGAGIYEMKLRLVYYRKGVGNE